MPHLVKLLLTHITRPVSRRHRELKDIQVSVRLAVGLDDFQLCYAEYVQDFDEHAWAMHAFHTDPKCSQRMLPMPPFCTACLWPDGVRSLDLHGSKSHLQEILKRQRRSYCAQEESPDHRGIHLFAHQRPGPAPRALSFAASDFRLKRRLSY